MIAAVENKVSRKRGRPRLFDPDAALAEARILFEARGYDRVTLSDLTTAMGINPPSFYAAFGNKAQLFARVLDSYTDTWAEQIRAAFALDRPVAQCLADIGTLAAHSYAAISPENITPGPQRRGGCLILEAGLNCSDPDVAGQIRKARIALATAIYRGVSKTEPERAAALTDRMMTVLAGLSAMARDGTGQERLQAIATSLAGHIGDA